MVRALILIILFTYSFDSKGQDYPIELGIEFRACFSKDTVRSGDSLKIILSYKNKTNTDIVFSPDAIIGINHYHPDKFISYDTPQRILYRINNQCSYDVDVNLKPNEIFSKTYDIKADSNFFYKGGNILLVFYHLYDKSLTKKRQRIDKRKPVLSLWSSPIKIYVSSKNCSLTKHPASDH